MLLLCSGFENRQEHGAPRYRGFRWAVGQVVSVGYALAWRGQDAFGLEVQYTTGISERKPTVSTEATTNIVATTATGNGTVSDLGDSHPTQHGHCWSTLPNPTIADDKTELGVLITSGPFISNITGLTPKTTYHCRAYATNAHGTSYGDDETFTTLAAIVGGLNPALIEVLGY